MFSSYLLPSYVCPKSNLNLLFAIKLAKKYVYSIISEHRGSVIENYLVEQRIEITNSHHKKGDCFVVAVLGCDLYLAV